MKKLSKISMVAAAACFGALPIVGQASVTSNTVSQFLLAGQNVQVGQPIMNQLAYCWRGYYGHLHCTGYRPYYRPYYRPNWRRSCWRGYYGQLHCRYY